MRRRNLRRRSTPGTTMTVHFIGAGPGAPDLITVRGRDLIARSSVCLYAGSLIPPALLDHCPEGARIVDTAPLDLDAIVKLCVEATARGEDVARLHSGDLSIWSAMGEQLRRLERAGVDVHGHARRARFRRRRRRAQARTDAARPRPILGADAHVRPRFADARARNARQFRLNRRDARDPSVDPCAGRCRRRAHAVLWSRLSDGGRRASLLAGRAHRARDARRDRGRAARGADRTHGAHPGRPGVGR